MKHRYIITENMIRNSIQRFQPMFFLLFATFIYAYVLNGFKFKSETF